MAGSLVDLVDPRIVLPDRLVVDSNIVIDWLLGEGNVVVPNASVTVAQERAIRFVVRLQNDGATGVIASTSMEEIFHVILKLGYRRALPAHGLDLADRFPNIKRPGWEHLFKARSDLVKRFVPTMNEAIVAIRASQFVLLQPDDLGPIPSGQPLEDELIGTMERYELDSADAAILVAARRAGIDAIVTADRDLQRARLDFDVFTWL